MQKQVHVLFRSTGMLELDRPMNKNMRKRKWSSGHHHDRHCQVRQWNNTASQKIYILLDLPAEVPDWGATMAMKDFRKPPPRPAISAFMDFLAVASRRRRNSCFSFSSWSISIWSASSATSNSLHTATKHNYWEFLYKTVQLRQAAGVHEIHTQALIS